MDSTTLAGVILFIVFGGIALCFLVAAFVPGLRKYLRWSYRSGTTHDLLRGHRTQYVERGPRMGVVSCLGIGTGLWMLILGVALGDKWPKELNWGAIVFAALVFTIFGRIMDGSGTYKEIKIKKKWKKPPVRPPKDKNKPR